MRLYQFIGTIYGEGSDPLLFKLPDLRGRVPLGFGPGPGLTHKNLGSKGGKEKHALAAGELPDHAHTAGTLATQSTGHAHNLGGFTDGENAHTHSRAGNTGSAGSHNHSVSGNTSGGGSHAHLVAASAMQLGSGNGSSQYILNQSAQPPAIGNLLAGESEHMHPVSIASASGGAHTHGISGNTGAGSTHSHALPATVSAENAHVHAVSGQTGSVGNGTAHENLPPFLAINFIIKW
jgi:microcystin-dependent protein